MPHLRRSALLTSGFHWGVAVRSLIEASDEVIPLMPLVEQAMEGLNHIEDVATRIHSERSAGDRNLMLDAIARVGDREGHPAVFRCRHTASMDKPHGTPCRLPNQSRR